MRITAIYDNGGKTLDRYTVVTDEQDHFATGETCYSGLGLDTGGHGFSQWSRVMPGRHLGRQIKIEDMDEETQKHIFTRIFANENDYCPKYPNDKVLPDEDGNCSLCGIHSA